MTNRHNNLQHFLACSVKCLNSRPFMKPYCFIVALTAFLLSPRSLRATEVTTNVTTNAVGKPIEIPGIHNAFRATDNVFSGSQPEGDEAFAALAKLGVKTILSVDGGKPDLELARKHGLRYVHLPYGYDSIPTNRIVELVKLTKEASGPFFVHCHHGLHRGPAAVAVMCESMEGWSPAKAEVWLKQAGTSPDYPGLYRAARDFKSPSPAEMAAVKALPEITKPSSIVEAMVAIDEHFAWLKSSQKAGWKTPPGHADISPSHEAVLLWEQLRELGRTDDTKKRPQDYQTKLADSERAAEAFRTLLKNSKDNAAIDAQFKALMQSCSACHKQYRNQ
jgi:protein tyrosine phosphatase (PTP) superfamily phosphohydrolase (DUF442 family)